MAVAVLALVGLIISLYLWLWKVGVLGELVCFDAGCETVQLSEYAYFLGVPVAFLGLVGYLAILAVSLVGVQPRWVERREPTVALIVLTALWFDEGEVATLTTTDLEGRELETPLWIAETGGKLYLRADFRDANWLERIRVPVSRILAGELPDTEFAHLFEHVALELMALSRTNCPLSSNWPEK